MFKIPTIMTADELLDKAFKKAGKVELKGQPASSEAQARVNSIADTLDSTLNKYVKAFPSLDQLDPFYSELVDLTIGIIHMRKALAGIDGCRKVVRMLSREYNTKLRRTDSKKDIQVLKNAFHGRVSSVVKGVGKELVFLNTARNRLKKLPTIDTSLPTAVIAGAPNVGKSALLRCLTNAKPKVAHFPFTTKDISIGHYTHRYLVYQFIDTPGLLDRELEDRNDIERRGVIALKHLADIVLLILDPTETCGYPLDYQLHLLEHLQEYFPELEFLVVENKSDLNMHRTEHMQVSALEGDGIDELMEIVLGKLKE